MNPLKRPMFVSKFNTGGSVYIPPALRYMAQNPDVFNASIANAEARGLQGLARQAQIERDAELHYAFHGQPEGRAYGGRTFLGGLLTPRLGDTFGLSPERRAELEAPPPAETEPIFRGPPGDIPGGFVPLVPTGDLIMQEGGEGFSEGGEVMSEEAQRQAAADALNQYQSSAVVQGYLASNPDVLASATRIARSRGIPPGSEFQRVVENAAREHYRDFGVREGRKIAGFPETGSILLLDEVRRLPAPVATTTESEGIASVPINPRMLAFANILANTRDMRDPGTEGELRAEFRNRGGGRGASTVTDIYDLTGIISPSLRDRLIDRNYGDTNEDKLPGRVDDIIRYMFRRNDDGDNAFEVTGGTEGLLRAYDQLGITGAGDTYADRQVTDFLDVIRQNPVSSINFDGTGGADQISLGGPTGTGYDSVQQMIADLPNMAQQFAAVPTINPVGILNTLYNMYTGDINRNPYDTSDATGTRPDRSVPSPMEFGGGMIGNAPLTEQQMQIMDALQFNSPGYPGLVGSGKDSGPYVGFQGIRDTPTFT